MLHKYSIFDLSTLEAMHYGNIPILTPVGGNKEVIIEDNGLFVSNFDDASSFIEVVKMGKVDEMKKKNSSIQSNLFDDRAFLQRYVNLCDEFCYLEQGI